MDNINKNYLLILIGVVVGVTLIIVSISGQNATQAIGFGTLICVHLFGLLQSIKTADQAAIRQDVVAKDAASAAIEVKKTLEAATVKNVAAAIEVKKTLEEATDKNMAAVAEVKKTLEVATGKNTAAVIEVKKTLEVATGKNTAAVAEVKKTLEEATDKHAAVLKSLSETASDTHTLVNSAMAIQLRVTALALTRVADLTGDPEDVETAKAAHASLATHEARQHHVDTAVENRIP